MRPEHSGRIWGLIPAQNRSPQYSERIWHPFPAQAATLQAYFRLHLTFQVVVLQEFKEAGIHVYFVLAGEELH